MIPDGDGKGHGQADNRICNYGISPGRSMEDVVLSGQSDGRMT